MLYPRVSLYALMLAALGIPLYIHLPRFASLNLGIELGAGGTIFLVIRLVDLVQDPLIGWAINRWPRAQSIFAVMAAVGLAIGFPLLFALNTGPSVVAQIIAILVLPFSSYSLGMILLYARSETLAATPAPRDLMTMVAFREGGMLTGVVVAFTLPTIFVALGASAQGYPAFGLFLGALAAACAAISFPIWQRQPIPGQPLLLGGLSRSGAMPILVLALVNSLPAAITSTLFLLFVEDRLQLLGKAGPLLILFFLSAGFSLPIARPLAIIDFVGTAFLASGNLLRFAVACTASDAALGADMGILPALFSVALNRAGLEPSLAFGIWSFVGKLGLALAAFLVLPLLERSGVTPDAANSMQALITLNASYAVTPCILKFGAMTLFFALPSKGQTT